MVEKIALAIVTSEWFAAAVVAALVRWLAAWLLTETGLRYKRWEGWAVTAVKVAEKLIPDETENAGLQRANKALLMLLAKYREATGVEPDKRVVGEMENLIGKVHADLEAKGTL